MTRSPDDAGSALVTSRVNLLSGAGSGIGEVLARRLLERGEKVWAVARSEVRAAEMAEALPGLRTVVADLAETSTLAAVVADLPDRLDSLVHAAGVVDLGTVEELSAATWTEQLAVNLVAPAVLTGACLPALRAARGTVVLLNSGAGLAAHPTWSAYAASKHGLRALADSLRAEEPDVRVTTVFPGRTATPMQERVHAQEGKDYDAADWIQASTVAEVVLGVLDLPRDAVVTEMRISPAG